MGAPNEIIELVKRFELHRESYQSAQYNETQLRREFVDPFFKALGWDIDNEQGYAEAYKDVVHEDAIKIGGTTKAPDYSFRIGGKRKFFVETKKPSVNIAKDSSPAFQLRRYAWTAKLPLSILTDFEEFAVYDCLLHRPVKTDKASKARTLYLKYTDYADRWDEVASIFSREAILKGSFDKYALAHKKKRGTAEVDDEFLKEIENWRTLLARNFALRNPKLSQRELNFAVQRTIDRIIFLRICEDRGVERSANLRTLLNGPAVYPRLSELFRHADDRYNSGLFHFHKEKSRPEEPDNFTLSLEIDDKPLKEIIKNLYYPDSPYEFSVLPADILGQVYEQFLGKVIRLTAGHQARIEDKPEVKKAGGVYYTPTYIVEYIVEQTVGKLLEGKTPREVGGLTKTWKRSKTKQPLTILDPACGSGSFLIGAYQKLLDWHLDWYVDDGAKKHKQRIYEAAGGQWRLTTAERKRILLSHIHGVDIDPQAVEVTKLSLLLKVLEGENQETLNRQLKMFRERALPDLASNIKCGNSLIGPDFYDGQQMSLFDEEEALRINVFDWEAEFFEIMKRGGFDAVIGNPPYVRIQTLKEWAPAEVDYYKTAYHSASKGNYDIYVVFIERGLSRLKRGGVLGYILPSKFITTDYGEGIRGLIAGSKSLTRLIEFRHEQVFKRATTYTCLIFLSTDSLDLFEHAIAVPPESIGDNTQTLRQISAASLSKKPWSFASAKEQELIRKLLTNSVSLLELPSNISRGSSSGADDVFMIRETNKGFVTRDGASVTIEEGILRVPIYATDFGRYSFRPGSGDRIIFPYEIVDGHARLLGEKELHKRYPHAYRYLESRKYQLEKRKQFKRWFGFSAPRNLDAHERANLMVPLLADKGRFCSLPDDLNLFCPMASGGFSIGIDQDCGLSPFFVLGVLNSKLLFWRLRKISNLFRGGWITCTKQYFGTLPIRQIDVIDNDRKPQHNRMVQLVEQMISLNERVAKANTDHQKIVIQRQIETTDRKIDKLVYKLYGLTDEEIQIVEEATST